MEADVHIKATRIRLNPAMLEEAKQLGINVFKACEKGLAQAISDEKMRRWNKENKEALKPWDDYIEKHGMPFAEYRQF